MSTWQAVADAVAADFADLDAATAARVGVRLLTAAVLGGVIGFEREHRGKPAGMRTHMLVAIGAALFVIVAQNADGSNSGDVSRVIQGLVAGIGFLGAGTILNAKREEEIKGLTTAASVWLTAASGVAAGLGREVTAFLSTALALTVLSALPWLVGRVLPPPAPETPPLDAGDKKPE